MGPVGHIIISPKYIYDFHHQPSVETLQELLYSYYLVAHLGHHTCVNKIIEQIMTI